MLFLLFQFPKFLFPSFCLPPVHRSSPGCVQYGDEKGREACEEEDSEKPHSLDGPIVGSGGRVLCFNGEDAAALEDMPAVFRVQSSNEDVLFLDSAGVEGGNFATALSAAYVESAN
jgi:hypothetical protein